MTTPSNTTTPVPPATSGRVDSSNFNEWNELAPKLVPYEDAFSPPVVEKMWQQMYKEAGIASAPEQKKKSFRLYVYIQGELNGTSRVGDYSGTGKLADGTDIDNAVIPRVCHKKIRKFYRGNMLESYDALKSSEVMLQYDRFIARAGAMGIGPGEAFAMADWMDDCPKFTPLEAQAHDKAFVAGIAKARRARDGRTLEQVEDGDVARRIHVNGPDSVATPNEGAIEF